MSIDTRELISELRLEESFGAQEVAAGRRSIAAVHLGLGSLTIGKVLQLIEADETLTPPRTGHLGNWSDIAATRAGPMDFNSTICSNGYGYPLIYGFNRTESSAPGGDEAYAPGSIIDRGQRIELPIYTWDGGQFSRRDREQPLFCPLVKVEHQGALRPLAATQWQRMREEADYPFTSWASVLINNRPLVSALLSKLITEAPKQQRNQAFDEIISHAVALDGTVQRGALETEGTGFRLAGVHYRDAEAVAEAALDLVSALLEPEAFFERIGAMPARLPVISLQCTNVLFALLSTHRHRGKKGPLEESPYRVHPHWGARAMAGAPPLRSGYLMRTSAQRSLRALVDPLLGEYPEVQPTVLALIPAAIFMLCPTSREPADAELLAGLFAEVAGLGVEQATSSASRWFSEHRQSLSPYLRNRFIAGAGVPRDADPLAVAESVQPPGFRELGIAEACAIAAAFEAGSA
ncbi:DUF6025 family protein [Psychromicrobium lacuslunae]|uniref:Uncharacterized protein n=1 Tax=Psychromicrobium lacuslunae TaxID=1618207 RepID=A0A0D4BW56_9MICC|nr:DUF6025 family protein [Psychromicrobium lacuslunae]AJT40365.1 hypothetical protein UM93_00175 [Psychromicrobium lacuslunae]